MRYLKLFESSESKSKIYKICDHYGIENYTINPDGSIDVDDHVWIFNDEYLTKLPLKFNKVNGDFNIHRNGLTTLEGSPVKVSGEFFCSHNKLTSFKGSPLRIENVFECSYNNIKSFEYFPNYVGVNFYCDDNPIWEVWKLFQDISKIELINDFDIFRDEDKDRPAIFIDRLNDFLNMIGKPEVKKVNQYKNI